MMAMNTSLLLLLLATITQPSNAFVSTTPLGATTIMVDSQTRSSVTTMSAAKDDDEVDVAAQRLMKIRADIAAMEGKTVEQVTLEAKQKKEGQTERRQEQDRKNAERKEQAPKRDDGKSFVQIPETIDDMIRQAARAVERGFQDGKTRQTVRFHLVEEDSNDIMEENQWPGGTKQMYREAGKPLTTALLREVRAPTKEKGMGEEQTRIAPTIGEQDIWDFDGSAIHTAQASQGPSGDVQALVFANTDIKYVKDIAEISEVMGPRLFLLINPFWRNIDSWSFNILAPGAKEKAQSVIFDNGYDETYVNLVFQVRGEKCVAIKAYPYDWQIFAFREDDNYANAPEYTIRLGSCKDPPTSALVTELLNERPEFKETKTMRQMKKIF
jgi:Skp family chaperone for outer membrane proteins